MCACGADFDPAIELKRLALRVAAQFRLTGRRGRDTFHGHNLTVIITQVHDQSVRSAATSRDHKKIRRARWLKFPGHTIFPSPPAGAISKSQPGQLYADRLSRNLRTEVPVTELIEPTRIRM